MSREYYIEPYMEYDLPYLFVSYAHVDMQKVEAVLNVLYRRGFRIWYDQDGAGIAAGDNWHETIVKRVKKSASFLCFLSSATEFRSVVIEEILLALEKKHADPEGQYKVVFVLLDKVSPEVFPADIKKELKESQFIDFKKYKGITKAFINTLSGVNWPEGIVDQEYRVAAGLERWTPNAGISDAENEELQKTLLDNAEDSLGFINESSEMTAKGPDGNYSFRAMEPEQIDRNTVYPIIMDNQWVPEKVYDIPEFYQDGLLSEKVAPLILRRQQEEIFRSLLHNRQIVVNRASILNSTVFANWYRGNTEETEAFAKLIENAAIVVFLFSEKASADIPDHFKIPEENKKAWQQFCSQYPVTCLRFDWENDDSNLYETTIRLSSEFHNFCLTMAENHFRLKMLAEAMGIGPEKQEAFFQHWRRVQEDVLAYRDSAARNPDHKKYSREQFYKSFLIKAQGSEGEQDVSKGILDNSENRPFAKELKRIIDFRYAINLPEALGIEPLLPLDSKMSVYLVSDRKTELDLREIATEELTYAVEEFHYDFSADASFLPKSSDLTLKDVVELRSLSEWKDYMRAVTEGKKRSHLDQVDFYDTIKVWQRFRVFLKEAKKKLQTISWTKKAPALSIIYRFEEATITTVYLAGRRKMKLSHAPETADGLIRRRTLLHIDYICCDVLEPHWKNVLTTRLRLFEGMTMEPGSMVYRELTEQLKRLGFTEV